MELKQILQFVGYPGMFLNVVAETGLLFGFVFPGESMLITSGVLAAAGVFNIWLLFITFFAAGIVGNIVGYYTGKKYGTKVFSREDSWLFHHKHVDRAEAFYHHHGVKTVILARFLPIIRSITPILAGTIHMNYTKFMMCNVIGSFVWSLVMTMIGYGIASRFPSVGRFLTPILVICALVYLGAYTLYNRAISRRKESGFF